MNVADFIRRYQNRSWDFDGYYGPQCVDLAQFYARELGYPRFWGAGVNIIDQAGSSYVRINNTPSFVPKAGDIVVWDRRMGNGYGHVAICTGAGSTSQFQSLDQNWGSPLSRLIWHNYTAVIGVLRPRKLITSPPAPTPSPVPKTVYVVAQSLYLRSGPGTQYKIVKGTTPDGMLHAGMTISIAKQVKGQKVTVGTKTSDIWNVSKFGRYFAHAGCR